MKLHLILATIAIALLVLGCMPGYEMPDLPDVPDVPDVPTNETPSTGGSAGGSTGGTTSSPQEIASQYLFLEDTRYYEYISLDVDEETYPTFTHGDVIVDSYAAEYYYQNEWSNKIYRPTVAIFLPHSNISFEEFLFDLLALVEDEGIDTLAVEEKYGNVVVRLNEREVGYYKSMFFWTTDKGIYYFEMREGDSALLESYLNTYPSNLATNYLDLYREFVVDNNIQGSITYFNGKEFLPKFFKVAEYNIDDTSTDQGELDMYSVQLRNYNYANLNIIDAIDTKAFMDDWLDEIQEDDIEVDVKEYESNDYYYIIGDDVRGLTWYDNEYVYVFVGNTDVVSVFDTLLDHFPVSLV